MIVPLQAAKPQTRAWRRWKKKTFASLNGTIPQLILSVLLLMSLFLAESWILGNAPDGSNDALYAILLGIFVIFVVEVALLSVVQDGYRWSFFFWMDVIGKCLFKDLFELILVVQEPYRSFWTSAG